MYIFLKALACPKSDMLDPPVILQNALRSTTLESVRIQLSIDPGKLRLRLLFDAKARPFWAHLRKEIGQFEFKIE